jgi:hypothetical protein
MAVFQVKCANKRVIIYEFDHHPPHCHVIMNGGDVKVLLETLEVFGTKGGFNCRVEEVPQKAQKYDAGGMGARNGKPNTLEETVDAPDLIATSVGEMLGIDCPVR